MSEDPDRVETLVSKSEELLTGVVNETYKNFNFNERNKEGGESFDAYLIALSNMAETCNFCSCPAMTDSLLWDRIVLAIQNEIPGNGYFRKDSSTWRDALIFAEPRRARQLNFRRLVEKMK